MSQKSNCNADEFDEEIEDGDDNGVIEYKQEENFNKKKRRFLFSGSSYKRAKKVVFSPINKFQMFYKRYKRSSSISITHNLSNNSSAKNGSYSCFLCLSKPQTLDTDYDGFEPNDPNVCFDHIKSLIEKNDYYCKECNTHIG